MLVQGGYAILKQSASAQRRIVDSSTHFQDSSCKRGIYVKSRQNIRVILGLQIVDFLDGVAEEHGEITGVTNLIGNMCIKPAHLTSDEEVRFQCKSAQEDSSTSLEQVVLLSQSPCQCAVLPDLACKGCYGQLQPPCRCCLLVLSANFMV